jgi:hypothetical protein
MVGIKLLGDKLKKVKKLVEEGIEVRVEYKDIKKEKVMKDLREVLENNR